MTWTPIESGGRCIYSVKKQSPIPMDRAQEIGEYIEDLEKTQPITPSVLVDDARKKSSKLHEFFEWNNTIAADHWRGSTARKIINHFEIAVVDLQTEDETTTRAWHSVIIATVGGKEFAADASNEDNGADTESTPDLSRVFIGTISVMTDADLRQQVLDNAMREMNGWRNRYQTYSELDPVFASINAIKEAMN